MIDDKNNILELPFKFLDEKFSGLPKCIQVLVYLTVLAAVLYWFFAAAYIDSSIEISHKGKTYSAKGTLITVDHSGRPLRIKPNGDGYFSFPVPERYPWGSFILSIQLDENFRDKIFTKMPWYYSYDDRVSLIFNRETKKLEVRSDDDVEKIGSIFGISSAYAGVISNEPYQGKKTITSLIISVVSDMNGIEPSKVDLSEYLREDLGFSNVELSILQGELLDKFKINLWNTLRFDATVGEIINSSRQIYYDDLMEESWLGERLIKSRYSYKLAEGKIRERDLGYFREARNLRKSGGTYRAIAMLEALHVKYLGEAYIIHFNLALSFDALGDNIKAKEIYLEAIEAMDFDGLLDESLLNTYGRFLYRQGDCSNSIKWFNLLYKVNQNRKFLNEYIEDVGRCIKENNLRKVE
jgi:hypothetical protein